MAPVAREVLDRVNPTGSWAKQAAEEPDREASTGNDPGRLSETRPAAAES
jgi:hypothetical protein